MLTEARFEADGDVVGVGKNSACASVVIAVEPIAWIDQKCVAAAAAIERVVASTTDQRIVARAASDGVVARVAGEGLAGGRRPDEFVDIVGEFVARQRGLDVVDAFAVLARRVESR